MLLPINYFLIPHPLGPSPPTEEAGGPERATRYRARGCHGEPGMALLQTYPLLAFYLKRPCNSENPHIRFLTPNDLARWRKSHSSILWEVLAIPVGTFGPTEVFFLGLLAKINRRNLFLTSLIASIWPMGQLDQCYVFVCGDASQFTGLLTRMAPRLHSRSRCCPHIMTSPGGDSRSSILREVH